MQRLEIFCVDRNREISGFEFETRTEEARAFGNRESETNRARCEQCSSESFSIRALSYRERERFLRRAVNEARYAFACLVKNKRGNT